MIELQNLTKKYGKKRKSFSCLEDVNLTFEDASLNLIIGKSGSGKTTLINLIGGIDQADSGNILFDGTLITKKNVDSYRGTNVGFVFQTLNLIESFTLRENFKIAFDLCSKEMSEDSLSKVLSLVSLPDSGVSVDEFLSRYPKELSVGQKQRAAIAIALVKDPSVLILDEPTSALDEENAGNLLVLLKELAKKITVIVTSHARDLFYDAADQVIEIKDRHAYVRKENGKRTERKEKPVLRSGFFSFVETLRIALFNLRNKKMRLVTSFILSFVAAGLFGVFYLLQTVDTNSVLLRTQIQEKSYGARIDYYEISYSDDGTSKNVDSKSFSDEQIKQIEEYTDGKCSPVYLSNALSKLSILSKSNRTDSFLGTLFLKGYCVELNPDMGMDDFSLVRYSALEPDTSCRLPRNDNEIAISDITAEILKKDGLSQHGDDTLPALYVDKVDDLIGMKLNDEVTVTGIFTTPDHELEKFRDYLGMTFDEASSTEGYAKISNDISGDSLAKYFFVAPGYYASKNETKENCSSYYVILKGDYSSDMRFLGSIEDESHVIELLNCYTGRVSLVKLLVDSTAIRTVLWVVVLLLIGFSVVLSLNLFYANVKSMEKDLGIFKAMGASKFAVSFIILAQALMVSLVELVLTVVAMSVVALVLNLRYEISLISVNAAVIGWLILILVVTALVISLLSARKALLKRPINVIQQ